MATKRLIDANALDALEELEYDYVPVRDGCAWYRAADVWACIESQPTVDAVEVVHGRWVHVPSSDMMTGKAYKCSECNKMRYGSFMPNYCQNCGAKMDRKDDT